MHRLDSAKYSFSNRLAAVNEWNDVSEEVIDSKILAGFFKPDICLRITGETYSFFLAYRLMHDFTFKFKIRTIHETEKYRHDDAK